MSQHLTQADNRKPYIYFSVTIVALFILLYSMFSSSLSSYLHSQITNEAIALAKSNSTTIQTLDTSAKAVHEILVDQLLNVANVLASTSTPDNVERNDLLSRNHIIDEVNWLSTEGEILYSSEDYEGRFFGPDHFFWTVVYGDQDYYLEDIRKGIYTGHYFLLLYVNAPDDTVVQVALRADRLVDLLGQFSVENLMQETLANERVICATTYIDAESESLSFVSSNDLSKLNEQQQEILLSKQDYSRVSSMNGQSILEIYTTIDDDFGNHIGSFFLAYSLTETENFVQIASIVVLGFLSLVAVSFVTLTIILYKRDRKITTATYKDNDTDVLNAEFIRDNYDVIQNQLATEDSTIAVFLISSFRRAQLLNSHEEMVGKLTQFVDVLKKHSESNEIYRYQDDVFFMLSHHRSEKEVLQSIQEVIQESHLNFELKTALIKDAAGYEDIDSLFEAYKVTVLQLRNNSDKTDVILSEDIHNQLIKRQVIERDLRLLSVQGFAKELFVVFHPQIDVNTGEVVGFETLTRWIHPEYGFIEPPLIFEIAENSDYYNALTRWILTQALEFIQRLNVDGYTKPIVSINAPNEYVLHPDCIHNVQSLLDHYSVCPHQLGFEITETTFDDTIDALRKRVSELNAIGITTYIDDYGRGYSSMVRLRDLDVNVLKIDKTFVDDIHKDERFLNSIINMANELNLEIVAEGAESEEQVEWLRENNCNVIQGYYFSKPLKFDDAIDFIKHFKKDTSNSMD